MTLPRSSAAVKRTFSQINLNETKIRNRLETASVNGILHTKRLFREKPSYEDAISKQMIQKHNNSMYEVESKENVHTC